MATREGHRPLFWVGNALERLREFPDAAKDGIGYALYAAQRGDKHRNAKVLKGFSGAGVLEIVEDHDGDTYRAIYTVRFLGAVYVLHTFKKKSKSGIATPKQEIDIIRERLRSAEHHYAEYKRKTESQ
ncbi:MAG: type II toxin-antitoxin system RelE/ParE family toxin [Candidatus Hydrogenedentes bacterium]|nr:type II toxin-antitoxin system RelE/ParE family toxin [Candidatus Hydrogenedentota bacterium]